MHIYYDLIWMCVCVYVYAHCACAIIILNTSLKRCETIRQKKFISKKIKRREIQIYNGSEPFRARFKFKVFFFAVSFVKAWRVQKQNQMHSAKWIVNMTEFFFFSSQFFLSFLSCMNVGLSQNAARIYFCHVLYHVTYEMSISEDNLTFAFF